jgi:aspartate ammonia-lyase
MHGNRKRDSVARQRYLLDMRIEKDSLGELKIPNNVDYGIQSFRASQNFQISGNQVHPEFIRSYLLLKRAAATANESARALDRRLALAIRKAIDALLRDGFAPHFIVDAYQAGAGTSQNMNTNEVVANRANQILGKPRGAYDPVHPNDHVNMSQSTNDSYPTAMRLATLSLSKALVSELDRLSESFDRKARAFDRVLKAGRTHLQDAVPIRLGQEFAAYRDAIKASRVLVVAAQEGLRELGIGGSAVGTGINVPRGFRSVILRELQRLFKDSKLRLSTNMCFAMQSQLPMMVYSNALRATALELTRIVNDLRLLSSGPTNGFAEILLPSAQPGSSIMPGKVNPSILEAANQVCFKVLGNDTAMAFAMQAGQLELNVMMPLMAQVALESTAILTSALAMMRTRCIDGIQADVERCRKYAEHTSALATALNPVIGYANAAEVTKESLKTGKSIVEIVRKKKLLSSAQIKQLLDLRKLTEPVR